MTASASELPRVRLSGPSDVVAAIPYLVGFQPVDSLVLMGIRDQLAGPLNRLDLIALTDAAGAHDYGEWASRWFSQQAVDAVIVLIYGDRSGIDTGLAALRAGLEAGGLGVEDVLAVAGGRYRSLICDDPNCCDPDGTPIPDESSPVVASLVSAGLVARSDRDALIDDVTADLGAEIATDAMAAAVALWRREAGPELTKRRSRALRRFVTALRTTAKTPVAVPVATEAEAAALLAALQDKMVRDALLSFCLPPWAAHTERLMVSLARLAGTGLAAAPPLTLLAAIAWQQGSGGRAGLLLERALAADPEYTLAQLWDQGLRQGLHPEVVHSICRDAGNLVVAELIGRMPRPPQAGRSAADCG